MTIPPTASVPLLSPAKRVRAEFAIATVWVGSTVYPDAPIWRVWCGGRPVIGTSLIGLRTARGEDLLCGMTLHRVTRHRARTPIGAGRELRVQARARSGAALNICLRLTDTSAFCEVAQPRKRRQDGAPLAVTNPPEGASCLTHPHPHGADAARHLFYAPCGKLIARWRHGLSEHIVFFDRPGDLAVRRFDALGEVRELRVESGRQGCAHLFLTVPFTKRALPDPVFGDALTSAFKEAFRGILVRDAAADDFWFVRGEPGEFAVAAERRLGAWRVCGVTGAGRTLTVRFEDLWLRTPEALRARSYTVAITRDPNANEAGQEVIGEAFAQQPPDLRVVLDLSENGGFVLAFTPSKDLENENRVPPPQA